MLRFNPSRIKFFMKDGDATDEGNDDKVTTFFDQLNLQGGGGSKDVNDSEDAELEDEELEDEETEDSEDDDENSEDEEPKADPTVTALAEQLKQSQEQNAKLMQLLQEKEMSSEDEDEVLNNPFDSEDFDNLAETMDWDATEQKAMKAFMQSALAYQSQNTLTTATEKISTIVNSTMSQAEKKKAVRKQFFTENPKLEPVKDYVSTVASSVLKEYKALGKSLDPAEILKDAAQRAYKTLGIDPKAEENPDKKSESDSDPAFPSMKGSSKKRNQKVKKTRNQKMITSMIDL